MGVRCRYSAWRRAQPDTVDFSVSIRVLDKGKSFPPAYVAVRGVAVRKGCVNLTEHARFSGLDLEQGKPGRRKTELCRSSSRYPVPAPSSRKNIISASKHNWALPENHRNAKGYGGKRKGSGWRGCPRRADTGQWALPHGARFGASGAYSIAHF